MSHRKLRYFNSPVTSGLSHYFTAVTSGAEVVAEPLSVCLFTGTLFVTDSATRRCQLSPRAAANGFDVSIRCMSHSRANTALLIVVVWRFILVTVNFGVCPKSYNGDTRIVCRTKKILIYGRGHHLTRIHRDFTMSNFFLRTNMPHVVILKTNS